jgi:hypothetical protein
MFLRLGGLDTAKDRHMTWFVHDIQVGDEITVRVLAAGEIDKPAKKHPRTLEPGKPTDRRHGAEREKKPTKRKDST